MALFFLLCHSFFSIPTRRWTHSAARTSGAFVFSGLFVLRLARRNKYGKKWIFKEDFVLFSQKEIFSVTASFLLRMVGNDVGEKALETFHLPRTPVNEFNEVFSAAIRWSLIKPDFGGEISCFAVPEVVGGLSEFHLSGFFEFILSFQTVYWTTFWKCQTLEAFTDNQINVALHWKHIHSFHSIRFNCKSPGKKLK